ncbi:MAG: zf-HC2 domain-containing protein [Candidatus Sulfotelmatobacter sp.]
MKEKYLHVPDEQLLLYAAEEMPDSSAAQIQAHLEDCATCRTRAEELKSAQAEFNEAHEKSCDTELPPVADARALLEARLTELADRERGNGWWRNAWTGLLEHRQAVMLAGAASAACLLLAMRLYGPAQKPQPTMASFGHWEEPDLRLTPGATVAVTTSEVCGEASEKIAPVLPVSLKRKVFELYGVTPGRPDAYEVDYLITPELGGATDIRNLWPEPYEDAVWNAHVKDQLEDRLHRMVCHGDVDLATAQRDISTDWIAAYRKYFHADRPVEDGTSSNFEDSRRSLPKT